MTYLLDQKRKKLSPKQEREESLPAGGLVCPDSGALDGSGVCKKSVGDESLSASKTDEEQPNCVEQRVKDSVRHSSISHMSQLFAGGVAGAVSKTCTAPLARLTILSQVEGMHSKGGALSRPSMAREAYRIATEEGFRAFWKGNGVTIVHRLPYSAISFYAYERYKRALMFTDGSDQKQLGMGERLLAGGAAGITAASLTYPLDLVRTRLSAQRNEKYYTGITHTLLTIYRDEGPWGLYKGLGATLLGVGPNIAMNFAVYETLKSAWAERSSEPPGPWSGFAFGSVAGIASSSVTFPFDLVRRRMQLEGAHGKAEGERRSVLRRFIQISKTQGWRGLYRGIVPEYLKVVPSVGIVFMTYEFIKSHLSTQ
eukprot:c18137_g1_i1 orf=439-1545(+)